MTFIEVDPSIVLAAVRGTRFAQLEGDGVRITRLPRSATAEIPDGELERVASQAAGVHLTLLTAATTLRLHARWTRILRVGDPVDRSVPVVVASIDGRPVARATVPAASVHRLDDAGGWTFEAHPATTVSLTLPTGPPREVDVWLPQAAAIEGLVVSADADVAAASPDQRLQWIHYGSSISQCVEAPDPISTWPALAAAELGWNSTSLGLSGQAMADPVVARVIRDLTADVVTLKIGINPVTAGSMTRRHFEPLLHEFVDVVRQGHPETTLVLISPIACPIHEVERGPTLVVDGRAVADPAGRGMSLREVRASVDAVVAARHVEFLDGRDLLGLSEAHLLADGLHPGPEGYRVMARRFADRMRILAPLGTTRSGDR